MRSRGRPLLSACSPAACFSPERLLAFLLPKLDTSNERTRVGSLQVLRHIINSAGECAERCLGGGGVKGAPHAEFVVRSLPQTPAADAGRCPKARTGGRELVGPAARRAVSLALGGASALTQRREAGAAPGCPRHQGCGAGQGQGLPDRLQPSAHWLLHRAPPPPTEQESKAEGGAGALGPPGQQLRRRRPPAPTGLCLLWGEAPPSAQKSLRWVPGARALPWFFLPLCRCLQELARARLIRFPCRHARVCLYAHRGFSVTKGLFVTA